MKGSRHRLAVGVALALGCLFVWGSARLAAQASAAGETSEEGAAGTQGMVSLNLPEQVKLKLLVDYVSEREGVNFVYEGGILNQTVSLKAPNKIPVSALRTMLESFLRMKGMTIRETEVEGLLRIVRVGKLVDVAERPGEAADAEKAGPTTVVTRLLRLQHAKPARMVQVVSPFLSGPNASLTVLEEHDLVLVTDYASNMPRIEEMFEIVDRPGRRPTTRTVTVEHVEAKALAGKVERLLSAKAKAAGRQNAGAGVTLVADERTNRLTIVGLEEAVAGAVELIRSLDVSLGLETTIYAFDMTPPGRVDELVKALIGEAAADRLYNSAVDSEANLLIATTTPEIHARIERLRKRMDAPRPDSQSPIRFYKLENAKAGDIVSLLGSIEGEEGIAGVSIDGVSAEGEAGTPPSPEFEGPTEAAVNRQAQAGDGLDAAAAPASVELPDARLLADEATNTIIIVARPSAQRVYQKLIDRLDVRRPQVLIEATVVVIDTSDDFSLGVEIFNDEDADGGDLLNFTQFGLTTDDSRPGSITLNPGTGFTGALLNASVAEVVIRALERDSRSRVVSRPTVLVNDNADGSLVSEQEEPFETVSVSDTSVERTSFGGFASAGTNISITPRISEGDHLNLEYEITLSSFDQRETASASTLPPARQTNTLSSEATIPDGHTIVVGGLTRENASNTIDRVPFLGSIPGLELLFSSRRETTEKVTLFVFINATILRDDKFEDLKVLSDEAATRAGIDGAFPESEPVSVP